MADIKKMKMVASFLRKSDHYLRNKESDFSSRFDFVMNKQTGDIDVFHSDKDSDYLMSTWIEYLIGVARAFGVSYYVHNDTYNTKRLTFHLY